MDSVHQWDMISTYERCGWILMLLLAIGALILERRGNIFEAQAVRHGSVPATGDSASHTIPPRLPSQPAATQTNKEDARRDAVNFVETGTIKDVKLTPEAAEILALTSIQVDFMQPAPEIMLIIGESLPAAANGEAAFRKIFKDARERLVELERQHSKRVVDEAGNAAVVVQPFKEERQALEKQVRQELVDLAGPSVAYVLWKGYSAQVLDVAGIEERELWIEAGEDSPPVLVERSAGSVSPKRSNIGRRDNFMYRYGHLFEDGK